MQTLIQLSAEPSMMPAQSMWYLAEEKLAGMARRQARSMADDEFPALYSAANLQGVRRTGGTAYIAARRKNGGGHCCGRTAVRDLSRGRYSGWLSGCWGRFDPPGFGELTKRWKDQGSRNWAGCPMGKKLNYVPTNKLRNKLRNKVRITPLMHALANAEMLSYLLNQV